MTDWPSGSSFPIFRSALTGRDGSGDGAHPFFDRHLYRSTIDSSSQDDTTSLRAHSHSTESSARSSESEQFFTLTRTRLERTQGASGGDSQSITSSEASWKYRRRRWRMFYIATAIISIVLILLTAVAIVIGLQGISQSVNSSSKSSNTVMFFGQLGLSNVTYTEVLSQKDSKEFQALAEQFCKDGIQRAIDSSSELTQTMSGCTVNSFSRATDGTVLADFNLEINDPSLAKTKSSLAAELVTQVLQAAVSRSQTQSQYNAFLAEKTSSVDATSIQVQAPSLEGSGAGG